MAHWLAGRSRRPDPRRDHVRRRRICRSAHGAIRQARENDRQNGGCQLCRFEQCLGEGRKPDSARTNRRCRPRVRRSVGIRIGRTAPLEFHPASGAYFGSRWRSGRADTGRAYAGRWNLHDVATSRFGKDHVDADTRSEATMRSTVNPDFLGLAATDPQLLTLHGLASYIDHLRRNSLDTAVFEIGFWSRIARLFAVIVVTLLALPFVFGPLRTTGAGTRTVIGVLLGVLFFLVTRTVENGGQLFGLNPMLVGWLPTMGVTLCTIVAISRTRYVNDPRARQAIVNGKMLRIDVQP